MGAVAVAPLGTGPVVAGDGGGRGVAVSRERVLWAMVEVVAERGYAGASVGLVCARAGVSRSTFYRCFEGREACFLAVIDLGLQRAIELVSDGFEGRECWRDGVRVALASLLVFFDSEPALARVWLVESLAAGVWALERRERNVAVLRELIQSAWPLPEASSSSSSSVSVLSLAQEGVMGSVLAVIHTHIVMGKPGLLIGLLGPLMGLITRPYLPGREVAREIERGEELAGEIVRAGGVSLPGAMGVARVGVSVPAGLENPNAHRTRRCLLYLADHPGVSNREVAVGIGVAHASQISRLLAGLLREGLVCRRSDGVGKRNAWRLTARGEETVQALQPVVCAPARAGVG